MLLSSLLVLAFASACGAPSTTSPSATAATGSPGASSPTPSGTGARASSVKDACALVTRSDVETVVGTVSEPARSTSVPLTGIAEGGSVCAYQGATGLLTIGVLDKALTRSDFEGAARQVPGVQPISGIGDAAYGTSAGATGASGASILVLKGSTYFTITSTSTAKANDVLLDALKTLAQKAVASL